MASADPSMTPAQAAEVLHDIADYEEVLTRRAGGMTNMVWGLASAAIFLMYGAADPYLEDQGVAWLYSVLWAPFVVAGVALTGAIWNAQAISLRRDPETRKGLLTSSGYALAFFAIAALLFGVLDVWLGVEWSTSSIMAMVNGLFAFLVAATMYSKGSCRASQAAAGVAMLAIGLALGASGIHFQAATLLAALGVGAAWFTAGIIAYARG